MIDSGIVWGSLLVGFPENSRLTCEFRVFARNYFLAQNLASIFNKYETSFARNYAFF